MNFLRLFFFSVRRPVRASGVIPRYITVDFSKQHQPSTPKLRRRQSSSKSSRRSSADWNARQATAGVSSGSISEYGWPAQVSREIIRLSLGEPATAPTKNKVTGRRPSRDSANADIAQRGHNVPRSSQVAGRPCPPLFSTNSSPSNLEGLYTLKSFWVSFD